MKTSEDLLKIVNDFWIRKPMKDSPLTKVDASKSNKFEYCLTVGELRKRLEGIPDDAKIFSQRVEDRYYEGFYINGIKTSGWSTVKKEVWETCEEEKWIEEYSPVFCAVQYKDDVNLYLNLHY